MLTRTFDAFGVVITVATNHVGVWGMLDRLLPPFPAAAAARRPDVRYVVTLSADRAATVSRDSRTLALNQSPSAACAELAADLQTMIACEAPGWTFVHAGVVGFDAGALVLPARSGGGKTTLVSALLRAGATYGSDEFAVLDARGLVYPYSRLLAFKRPGEFPRWLPFTTFGRDQFEGGRPVRAIVFTSYAAGIAQGDVILSQGSVHSGISTLSLRRLTTGEAVVRLLEHCAGARRRPSETLQALSAMAQHAECLTGPRGEAESFAASLTSWIDQPSTTRIS